MSFFHNLIFYYFFISFLCNPLANAAVNQGLDKQSKAWWPWSDPSKEKVSSPPIDQSQTTNSTPSFNVLQLEENLAKKVIGQSHAIKITSDAFLCYQAGIQDTRKPIGSFLYIGPTGVGKTELAKELARQVFGDEKYLIRFDMAEYRDREGLTKLIGVPHGYQNTEKGGLLSNAILKHPHSVVLLDEIEKSDLIVRSLFLHIFDEGYFTSATGEIVDCRQCVFIATTNLGSSVILQQKSFCADTILKELEPSLIVSLSPEFYNRVEPVVFQKLSFEFLEEIIDLKLSSLAQTLFNQKQITLNFDETLIQYLKTKGYHEELGVRPLQRLIKQEITPCIAKALLSQQYFSGDEILIRYQENQIYLDKVK